MKKKSSGPGACKGVGWGGIGCGMGLGGVGWVGDGGRGFWDVNQ